MPEGDGDGEARVLRLARGLNLPFRPVEITDIDGEYHAFIVRYSGDYVHHEHDRDEFVYILEGVLVIEMAGKEEEVRQGEAILIPAGTRHRPRCKARPSAWWSRPRVSRSRWTLVEWRLTAPLSCGCP